MKELKLVVFDMAGTTVRDDGQVPQAFTAALAEHGLTVTPEQLNRVRGSAKRQAVWQLLPAEPEREARAEKIYAAFCRHLTQRYQREGVAAIDGAAQVFQWLRAQGIKVALNTGFDRDITRLLLAALGWQDGVVDAVVCGDDVRQGRPAPEMIFHAMAAIGVTDVQQVMNVGDTVLDLQAGHHAGVRWNVGVLSGAHGRAQLEPAPHTHLLPSVAALPELWAGQHRENMNTGFEPLFSYGSLQNESVQLATFGRKFAGQPDTLPGYREARIEIQDRSAVAASGAEYYLNAQFTGQESDFVAGTRFDVTRQELEQADVYEATAQYRRVSVQLQSGAQSWVYVSAASGER